MTSEWKTYARALSRQLHCPKAKKKALLEDTRRLAEDYLAENPGGGHDGLTAFLGSPEELAQSYLEAMGPEAERYRRHRRLALVLLCAATAAIVVGSVLYCIYLGNKWLDVEITREETIIIYEPVPAPTEGVEQTP